ncbi:hypothetical protein SAMN04489764_2193 [Thermostaphylospora chromogena]|uniref:DUF4352 domain-containing protein n=2 Tax=Thermostaphylospora chromogena TaxID=35622 RepID=A0A1H1DVT1_9ACTN|nr:hypothetical protein SAMN04489764_2193 [Thermostaphylospora chromogena]
MTAVVTPPSVEERSVTRPPRRRMSRVGSAVLGIALAAAAVGAQHFVLDYNERTTPLTYTGTMGEAVDTGRFSARALSVKAARSVEVPQPGSYRRIEGDPVFILVETSATSAREPMKLTADLLTTDGKVYRKTDKVDITWTLEFKWIQPGWWASGMYVFEVPAEALPGASIVVRLPTASETYVPEAEIDLGLDEASANALVSGAQETYRLGNKS